MHHNIFWTPRKNPLWLFFSLEMSSEQLSTRILSEQARIKSDDIRRGKVTEDEINRYIETSRNIYDLPFLLMKHQLYLLLL